MKENKNYVYKLLNGKKLTELEFINYFEKKVFKTIKKFSLLNLDDKVCVAVSGGKDSIATLYLIHKYMKKKNLENNLFALAIDEGIENYRDETLEFLKKFCLKYKIKLYIESYKKEFKTSQDENVKFLKENNKNISPCNICGTFRRNILNKKSREFGATKLITGHNLDDEAQNIMLNIFKNNFKILARLGPINGVNENKDFVKRVKPLYLTTEKEVLIYTYLKKFGVKYTQCPYSKGQFRDEISEVLNNLEDNRKGVKYSIINFFLEIQNDLKKKYKESEKESSFKKCTLCGEPTQKKICNTCEFKILINSN